MPGDDPVKKQKKKEPGDGAQAQNPMNDVARATQQFEAATKQAVDVISKAERAMTQAEQLGLVPGKGGASGAAGLGVQQLGTQAGGGSLEVSFPPGSAPPPAFAAVCVVHRFPEYVLIDFGSIDPLQVEPIPGGQKAALQHVGRVCLPESAAKRLLTDLANIYGSPAG